VLMDTNITEAKDVAEKIRLEMMELERLPLAKLSAKCG